MYVYIYEKKKLKSLHTRVQINESPIKERGKRTREFLEFIKERNLLFIYFLQYIKLVMTGTYPKLVTCCVNFVVSSL